MRAFYQQCRGILVANIIFAHRKHFFWKLMFIQAALLSYLIMATLLSTQRQWYLSIVACIPIIEVVMLTSQFLVLHYIDNSQKFLIFQRGYGLKLSPYITAWIIYCLCLGLLAIGVFCGFLSIFYSIMGEYFSSKFQIGQYFSIYPVILQGFISNFSYFFCSAVLIPSKQIGIKIVTALSISSFAAIIVQPFDQNLDLIAAATPIGRLVAKLYSGANQDNQYQPSTLVFFAQTFIPLIIAIITEVIKYNLPFILYRLNKRFNLSKHKIHNQSLLKGEFELKTLKANNKIITLDFIRKSIGKVTIIHNISSEIYEGETVLLCGANGSGKSTLISIIARMTFESGGKFIVDKEISIGVSTEENFFYDELTVKENLIFYTELKGLTSISQRINALLEDFDLFDFRDKKYYKISFGSKRKLSIACAFLGNNHLVLLDEPLMGIDIKAKGEIMDIIRKIQKANYKMALIISTSDPELQLMELANRVWWMEKGELVLNKRTESIEQVPQFYFLRLYPLKEEANIQKEAIMQLIKEMKRVQLASQSNSYMEYTLLEQYLCLIMQVVPQLQRIARVEIISANLKNKTYWLLSQPGRPKPYSIRTQQINLFMSTIANIEVKRSYLYQFFAATIIRYYQITPNIITKLYFIFIMLVCGYFYNWMVDTSGFNNFQLPDLLYLDIYIYIYLHVPTNQLEFKATSYEITTFTQGMKAFIYWLVGFLFNILLITVPSIIYIGFLIAKSTSQDQPTLFYQALTKLLGLNCSYILTSYCYTLLFSYSFVCFSFIIAVMITFQKIIVLLIFYVHLKDNKALIIFLEIIQQVQNQCSDPWQAIQCIYVPIAQSTLYACIFILGTLIAFKRRLWTKDVKEDNLRQIQSKDAMEEMLRTVDLTTTLKFDAITVQDIYLQYSKKSIIKGINLGIAEGTSFGLIGHNASGKSTLIKLITSQIANNSGNVFFGGRKIDGQHSAVYEEFGLCPQVNYLIPEMTVRNHLRILLLIKGVPMTFHAQIIISLLRIFTMEDDQGKQIRKLSGGGMRKLVFVSALVAKPRYIFLDQPTIGIDAETQNTLGEFIEESMAHFGTTVVWITHKIDQAQRHCRRVGIMTRGEFVKINAPSRLIAEFSRGYSVVFRTHCTKSLRKRMIPILDKEFRVYELRQEEQRQRIRVAIPDHRFNLERCMSVALNCKREGLCVGFEVRMDRLQEVFSYLISVDYSKIVDEDEATSLTS